MGKRKIRVPGYFEVRATGTGPTPAAMLRALKGGAARRQVTEGDLPPGLERAVALTAQDKRQRWVTTDGVIHTEPVPYRDKWSVRWSPIPAAVVYEWRPRLLAHAAPEVA